MVIMFGEYKESKTNSSLPTLPSLRKFVPPRKEMFLMSKGALFCLIKMRFKRHLFTNDDLFVYALFILAF